MDDGTPWPTDRVLEDSETAFLPVPATTLAEKRDGYVASSLPRAGTPPAPEGLREPSG